MKITPAQKRVYMKKRIEELAASLKFGGFLRFWGFHHTGNLKTRKTEMGLATRLRKITRNVSVHEHLQCVRFNVFDLSASELF